MPELKEMTERVKHSSKKHSSDQRAFIEALIEWVAVKSIPFRSIHNPLFREMTPRAKHDFFVPHQSPRKDKQRRWRSELKEPDEVIEVVRDHHPDESGKGTATPSKASHTGGGRNRAFEPIIIGGEAFFSG
jgi:hypothetical protein